MKEAVRYLTPEECVERGYAKFAGDALRSIMVAVDEDGNVVDDVPKFMKTSVQKQWDIVFREQNEKVSG